MNWLYSILAKIAFYVLKRGVDWLVEYAKKRSKVADAKKEITEALNDPDRKNAAARINAVFK